MLQCGALALHYVTVSVPLPEGLPQRVPAQTSAVCLPLETQPCLTCCSGLKGVFLCVYLQKSSKSVSEQANLSTVYCSIYEKNKEQCILFVFTRSVTLYLKHLCIMHYRYHHNVF